MQNLKKVFRAFIGTFRLMHFLPVMTMTTIAIIVSLISLKEDRTIPEFIVSIFSNEVFFLPALLLVFTVFFQEAFCGIQNDYLDREIDALYNKRKAITEKWVNEKYAFWLSILFFIIFTSFSLAVSFYSNIGFWSLLYVQGANGVGIFYNLYAKNRPISILPYMIGFPLLPGYVWLTLGGFTWRYLWILPVIFFASFPAHIANELPDYELDEKFERKNFAVVIGKNLSTILYWLGVIFIDIIIIIVFFLYHLNLWIFLGIILSSIIVGILTLFILIRKKWETDILVFNLVTVCIGIEVMGFFVLFAY